MKSPANRDEPSGLGETNVTICIKAHHVPALQYIQKEYGTDDLPSTAITALAFAACHPDKILAFWNAVNAYAESEGLDMNLAMDARIQEAARRFKIRARRVQ